MAVKIIPTIIINHITEIAGVLLTRIDACLIERELNADLHIWLIDFEGSRLMLKGEHYSGALWLEALSAADNDTLTFIASLLPQQLSQMD